jgi:hypothetical protein
MMTKVTNLLQRVVMMALAIVVILYTHPALAGPLDRIKRGVEEAKKTKEGIETVRGFASHADRFFLRLGWEDFTIGRSIHQCLFMWVLLLGLVLIYSRKWKNADSWVTPSLILSYFKAMAAGFGFELIRTYPEYSATAYTLYLVPLSVLALGLFLAQFKLLHNFGIALRSRRFRNVLFFLNPKHRKLPPALTGNEEEDGDEGIQEAEPENGFVDDSDDVEVPEVEAADSSPPVESTKSEAAPAVAVQESSTDAPAPAGIKPPADFYEPPVEAKKPCPACGKYTPADGKRCAHCGVRFKPSKTTPCRACGKETPEDGIRCAHCGTRFKKAPLRKPKPKKTWPKDRAPHRCRDDMWETT